MCYLCEKELLENALIIPVNVNVVLPYGMFQVTVVQHYMCGLDCYLNVERLKQLNQKDRFDIEAKLMETISNLSDVKAQPN